MAAKTLTPEALVAIKKEIEDELERYSDRVEYQHGFRAACVMFFQYLLAE